MQETAEDEIIARLVEPRIEQAQAAMSQMDITGAYHHLSGAFRVLMGLDDALYTYPSGGVIDRMVNLYTQAENNLAEWAASGEVLEAVLLIIKEFAESLGIDTSNNDTVWWHISGEIPFMHSHETAIWVAQNGIMSLKIKQRLLYGRWETNSGLRAVEALVKGPLWMHEHLEKSGPGGLLVSQTHKIEERVEAYVKTLWREGGENFLNDLNHVLKVAVKLSRADKEGRKNQATSGG